LGNDFFDSSVKSPYFPTINLIGSINGENLKNALAPSSLLLDLTWQLYVFFWSVLGIQEKFHMNIFDDLEYLNDSKYFHEQKGKLFDIEAIDDEMFFDADTRNYKKKLRIDKNISNKSIYSLNGENFDDLFITTSTINNEPVKLTEALVFEFNLKNKNAQNNSSRKSDSTCSSRSSHTSDG